MRIARTFPTIETFLDELEKLGVSSSVSHFVQSRRGRRPIRVQKLIKNEAAYLPVPQKGERNQDAERAEDLEMEGGSGFADKMASARQILKVGNLEYEVPARQMLIRKVASLAGDLRRNGIGGVKRPPFPTEDSKRHANTLMNQSQRPGQFTGYSKPKNLIKPGPSIPAVATIPSNV